MKLRVPRTTTYDLPLVLAVVALTLLGLAMVYSASGIRALDALEDPRYFLAQQSAWASLGVAGMIVASRVGYHRFRALAVPLLALAILLLVLVLVPGIGVRAGGAARWLRLGELIGVQPAEVAKLALILYLGTWLGARREALRSWPITAWFLAVTAVIAGLVLGGPFGEGLGAGREKFGFLPAPYTDSIFAVLGDELGLAGTLAVVVLFLVLAYRGVRIAIRAQDPTGALIATGITVWLASQAWVNMAVVASLVPMTGLTLPFISYGGSSLCVGLIAVGILLNVGRHAGPAPANVSRAPRRGRDGRSYQPAPRGRRGPTRDGSRGGTPLHRWSSRARG